MTLQSQRSTGAQGDETAKQISDLSPWFHNLHLPTGHQTAPDHPLGDFPRFKWDVLDPHIPTNLEGWHALDIGCNAGFYSFELARRGAEVLAIDLDEHYLDQARWASDLFGLRDRVRFERMQVYDLIDIPDRFDLVLFMGVLYHLRYPLLALDIVADKTDRFLVLQTLTMPGEEVASVPRDIPINERTSMLDKGWPKMAFIEQSLAGDPTNWWAPNHACIEAMLRSSGFTVTARPGHEIYLCEASATQRDVQRANRAEMRVATRRAEPEGRPSSS